MNSLMVGIFVKFQNLVARKEGQDLVEYSLAFGVIALGVTAGMQGVASAITTVFNTIAATLATYL